MTGGGSAAPEPLDLSEISRSGDLFDALAARRVDPRSGSVISDDPAARLLAALVVDVDVDAPPLPVPARVSYGGPKKPGRPVVRAFVAFGAVTVMLTTAGAAVAGGGGGGEPKADSPSARLEVSERARPGLESIVQALSGAPRPTADRTAGEARPSPSPSATKTSGVPTAPAKKSTAPAKKGHTPGFPGPPHSRPFGPRRGPSATPSPTPSPTAPTDSPAPISAPPSATPQPQDQTSGDPSHRSRR